jgi:hypothetical protein
MLNGKTLTTLVASLALAACGPATAEPGPRLGAAVAQLHSRAEEALVIGWRAFDALLAAVDALRERGVIKPGSPSAIKLAALIERIRAALDDATVALGKGDDAGFAHSLGVARSSLDETKAMIGDAA